MRFPSSSKIHARHAFLLGAILAFLALAPAIWPYGGRFVTRGDYIEQQLPFILETRRILRAGLGSYSFSTFLGAPAIGSFAFYTLGSPFVWPLALLPEPLIPYGISVMAVLKHAFCALCAFCFLRKVTKDARLSLLGSMLYAFSSFTVVNTQFYHFTEVVAFFPLILWGLEDAMGERPHVGLLALACALNTLTNYYFMLGSALLAALYFAFRFFSEDWKNARDIFHVFRVVFECGVGCALAGVLLVPSALFMLSITRTGAGAMQAAYPLSTLLERLRALLMPIESNVVHAFFGDAPCWASTACYLPVFGLTGAAVFFLRVRNQRWLKALLALLLISSGIPALCGAFALFTNLSYTRWWYGLALLLTLATLLALRDLDANRSAWLRAFAALCALCAALTLPFMLPFDLPGSLGHFLRCRRTGAYADDIFRALSLGLSMLGGLAFLFLLLRKPRFRVWIAAVGLVAVVQYAGYILVGDACLLAGGNTPTSGVYTLSEIAEPTLSALSEDEPDGYTRIDYGPMLRNYGLLRGRSSITCFSSLRSGLVGRFVSMTGFGWDESTTVRPPDASPAIRALLSVGEYHATDGEEPPEGFVYDRQENGFAVYRNENAVPMGFLQTVCTGDYHQRMAPDTVADVMLAAVTLDDDLLEVYGPRLQRLDVYAIPDWQTSAARLKESACDRFLVNPSGFSAHLTADEAGIVVFTIPYDKDFRATIDGVDADILLCDISFMGVFVEPGEHEIVFRYRARGLALGCLMSTLAVLTLAAYVLLSRKMKTRAAC